MEQNNKRRAEDAERPAEELKWDCGACPGDGSICPTTCKLAEESPPCPAAPAVDAAKLDELGKLKALAEAATGGEWTIGLFGQLSVQDSKSMLSDCDAQYIRAAQPAAILRIAALVAQHAARIEELARERTQQRLLMSAALADLYRRMQKSYSAEPTRRITFMDLDAVHEHVVRLGLGGGCLDAVLESEGK